MILQQRRKNFEGSFYLLEGKKKKLTSQPKTSATSKKNKKKLHRKKQSLQEGHKICFLILFIFYGFIFTSFLSVLL